MVARYYMKKIKQVNFASFNLRILEGKGLYFSRGSQSATVSLAWTEKQPNGGYKSHCVQSFGCELTVDGRCVFNLLFHLPLVADAFVISLIARTEKMHESPIGSYTLKISDFVERFPYLNSLGESHEDTVDLINDRNERCGEISIIIKQAVTPIITATAGSFKPGNELIPKLKGQLPYSDSRGRGDLQEQTLFRFKYESQNNMQLSSPGGSIESEGGPLTPLPIDTPRVRCIKWTPEQMQMEASKNSKGGAYGMRNQLSSDDLAMVMNLNRPGDIRIPVYYDETKDELYKIKDDRIRKKSVVDTAIRKRDKFKIQMGKGIDGLKLVGGCTKRAVQVKE